MFGTKQNIFESKKERLVRGLVSLMVLPQSTQIPNVDKRLRPPKKKKNFFLTKKKKNKTKKLNRVIATAIATAIAIEIETKWQSESSCATRMPA